MGHAWGDRERGQTESFFRLLTPPYASSQRRHAIPGAAKRGSVALIEIPNDPGDLTRAVELVRLLRRSHPALAIGGLGDAALRREPVIGSRLLSGAGLRIWLDASPTGDGLRLAIGTSGFDQSDVETWLENYLKPRGLLEIGAVKTVAGVLTGGVERSTKDELRRWVRRLGLPTVTTLETAGRVISGIVQLQASTATKAEAIGRACGFTHASSYSHACRRLFGVPPSYARNMLGWEWLLAQLLENGGR